MPTDLILELDVDEDLISLSPLATQDREPRQARKGAAVTVDPGAGVRLGQVTANSNPRHTRA